MKEHGLSIVRACSLMKLSRTAWYRVPRSRMERDREVVEVLNEIVARKPRWGFWKLYDRLLAPFGECRSGELGAIAHTQRLWFAVHLYQLLGNSDDSCAVSTAK